MCNIGELFSDIEQNFEVVVVRDFGDIVKVVETEPLPADPHELINDGRVLLAQNAHPLNSCFTPNR